MEDQWVGVGCAIDIIEDMQRLISRSTASDLQSTRGGEMEELVLPADLRTEARAYTLAEGTTVMTPWTEVLTPTAALPHVRYRVTCTRPLICTGVW